VREIRVVAAVIERRGRVLLARRPLRGPRGGKWEFPGGKVEPGESPEAALARELGEEFGIAAGVLGLVAVSVHRYPDLLVRLEAYWVRVKGGALVPREHSAVAWLAPERLLQQDLSAADVAIAREVAERLQTRRPAALRSRRKQGATKVLPDEPHFRAGKPGRLCTVVSTVDQTWHLRPARAEARRVSASLEIVIDPTGRICFPRVDRDAARLLAATALASFKGEEPCLAQD
jgi:mutator protein MutT